MPISSGLIALLWGVAFANIVHGVPLNANGDYTGDLLDLLNGYGILGGLTVLAAFALHGALFLSLRTRGELAERSRQTALRLWLPTAASADRLPRLDGGRRRLDGVLAAIVVVVLAGCDAGRGRRVLAARLAAATGAGVRRHVVGDRPAGLDALPLAVPERARLEYGRAWRT